ncbi:vWA domain-containing protein [Microbacteriaceae bacterium 4G12]
MKTSLIATIVLALFCLVLLPLGSAAKEEGAKKRVVSLVYDDSGSMRNAQNVPVDRWKYANYALQSLIGLLDDQDQFFYVPMSRPSKEIPISLSKRQAEIEQIRKWSEFQNTPFQAVETAIEALKSKVSTQRESEFWLVILTDGAFNELETTNLAQYEENKKKITSTMQQFSTWMESQKASVHCILITMESHLSEAEKAQMNTFKMIWKETTNGVVMETNGEDGVVESINQAAALIANRDPFSNVDDLVKVNVGQQNVTVKTPFPLRRLTIVQQMTSIAAANIQTVTQQKERTTFTTSGPFIMQTPEQPLITGYISHIYNQNGSVMKPGEYEIQFDKQVAAEHIKVLVEPALDYTVHMYKKENKSLIGKEEAFYSESTILIEAKPNDIPVDVSYFAAEIELQGQRHAMKWDPKRRAFQYEVKLGNEPIRGQIYMSIKGFYQQNKEFKIVPVSKPALSLQVITKDWRKKVTDLDDTSPLIVQPLLNGQPMSEEEVNKLLQTAHIEFNKRVAYKLQQHNNQIYLYPRPYFSDTFNFTDTGTVEATMTLQSPNFEKVKQKIAFYIEDVTFLKRYEVIFRQVIPIAIGSMICLILLVGWIIRPRFHRTAFMFYELDQSIADDWVHKPEPELLRNSWWKHYIGIPFRAERRTVQSVTFIAKKGTKAIFIAKESQVEGMVIDGSFLEEEEIGKEHKTFYPNETIFIDKGYGKEVYRYECD